MSRITVKYLDAQQNNFNALLGYASSREIGALQVRFTGNGGNTYTLYRVVNENGGLSSFYCHTLTNVSRYLDGMIQGARMTKWSD